MNLARYTEAYSQTDDFTGTNGDQDPGDFDGSLGDCSDTIPFYPANTIAGKIQPVKRNGDALDSSFFNSTDIPGIPSDYLNSAGVATESVDDPNDSDYAWRLVNENVSWRESITNCDKEVYDPCDCDGVKILGICFQLQYWCLFGAVFCKKCRPSCPDGENHDCNKGVQCGGGLFGCCSDCCVKIPLIPLRCAETGEQYVITLIPTPFGARLCNRVFVAPFTCLSCGGPQTPGIKDWLSCVLEGLAVSLRMLKFDFYNDWVGGSLYFPLIKRKYKLKKSKRKFGQIKKDKFCDYECRVRNSDDFQGDETFEWRIKIPSLLFSNPTLEVNGCTAKLKVEELVSGMVLPKIKMRQRI